jgi:hypothetical protein
MTEKSKKILIAPEKAQTFVCEPIEGFNLESRFLTWTPSKHKKVQKWNQGQKWNQIGSEVCIDVEDTYFDNGRRGRLAIVAIAARLFFVTVWHFKDIFRELKALLK